MTNGYGKLRRRSKFGKHIVAAHRYAWFLQHGNIPELYVCHRCDNRKCVNPSHLFLGTATDNMADMIAKGRKRHGNQAGESNPRSKLTLLQVQGIRALLPIRTNVHIARMYGVHHATISAIRTNHTWKKLDKESPIG